MINYEYPPVGGGGGVLCRDLAEGLVEKGHEVAVITSQFRDSPSIETMNGVSLHRVPVLFRRQQNVASMASMLSYVPLAINRGGRVLADGGFDLLNSYFAVPSGPAGNYLSRKFTIPNVLHILGGDIYDPSKVLSPHRTPLLRATVKKMVESADRVVAESTDIEKKARRHYGIRRGMDIIPLAVKPNAQARADRASLGLKEDEFVLITVGRLIRRKNLSELLDILGKIRTRVPCRLLVVGEGPEGQALAQRAAALGLEDSVRFAGRVTERRKFELLKTADIYVSTALHEGFGIVFLEAMECGLPVVCYDRGGQTDFLSDGRTGCVIALSNTEEFTRCCCRLYEDSGERAKISSHNAAYVKNFYLDRFIERHLEVFQGALAS
jgi:glycosyltransferase involved in cell wall biosynthesis